MSVIAQLPPELGGAQGKVAYIDTEGVSSTLDHWAWLDSDSEGTFRPDRIRSIAERFGVNGDMALENILYGERMPFPRIQQSIDKSPNVKQGHGIVNTRLVTRSLDTEKSINGSRWS